MVLVGCLMGSRPTTLNSCHVDVIYFLRCCYVKVILYGMPPNVRFDVNCIPLGVWR